MNARAELIRKPRLRQVNGAWRAEIRDDRGVGHYGQGRTWDDAMAVLARSYQLPSAISGEVASADPFRLFPQNITPFNPSILVQRRGLRVFDEMRRDDQVKAALTFKKHAVFAAGWRVDSPEGRPDDWEPTEFIREQLEALEGTFAGVLLEMLSALDYGFSASEKIFSDESGQVTLSAIKTRAPHAIEFQIDRHGNLTRDGILQWQNDKGLVPLPAEKFVLVRNAREFGNPYGTSDLEAAYRGWWTKQNAYKWLGMLLERYGIPPVIAKYRHGSLNARQIEALKEVLTNLQAATAAIVPFGENSDDIEFWSPELAGQVSRVFEPAISMFNTDISRAILMPGLLGLTPETRVGSMARARVIFDVFLFVRDHLAQELADTAVNDQIIRPLVELNFGVDEIPQFRFLPIDDNLQKELFDSWVELVGAGVVTRQPADEAHIRQLLDFPARDEDTMEPEPENGDEPEEPDEDGDEPENGDSETLAEVGGRHVYQSAVVPGRLPQGDPIRREQNAAERAVNMQALEDAMDRVEQEFAPQLASVLERARGALIRKVQRNGLAASLSFTGRKDLRETLSELLSSAFKAGRETARTELPRAAQEPLSFVDPAEALEALSRKAFFITGILSDRTLAEAREALFMSVKLGETTQAAGDRLSVALEGVFTPARIETIVRTNTTDAFNLGRLNEMRRSPLVSQVMYSAILDSRTTPVCLHLDQRRFRRDDPALATLSPPNHHQCRSVLVPVPVSAEVPADQLITESQKGRGLELAQQGFV